MSFEVRTEFAFFSRHFGDIIFEFIIMITVLQFKGSSSEFLNTQVFFDIADAREKLEEWRND